METKERPSFKLWQRAIDRAHAGAQFVRADTFVYRTKRGFVADTAKPVIDGYWRVSPQGQITEVSSGK